VTSDNDTTGDASEELAALWRSPKFARLNRRLEKWRQAQAQKPARFETKTVVAFMVSEFGWTLKCNDVEAAARKVLERLTIGCFLGHLVDPEEMPKRKLSEQAQRLAVAGLKNRMPVESDDLLSEAAACKINGMLTDWHTRRTAEDRAMIRRTWPGEWPDVETIVTAYCRQRAERRRAKR
jgi:hypothetical protein